MSILWLIALPALASAADAPADLLSRTVSAEKENRVKARDYVFREVIRFSEIHPDGTMVLRRANTFEVTFLEGEPFHRLVAVNGEPLKPEELEKEEERFEKVAEFRRKHPLDERRKRTIRAEGQRFRIDIGMVEKYHDIFLKGETELNGRRVWVLDSEPKPGTRKPRNRMEWTLSQRCRYWIDQETLHPIRLESTQLYDWEGIAKDSLTESSWSRVENVWLVSRIRSTNYSMQGKVRLQTITDQVYSNFRHFQSDIVITYQEDPPPPPL